MSISTRTTAPGAPTATAPGGARGIGAWFREHKTLGPVAIAGGVLVAALLIRSKSSKSAGSGSTGTGTTADTTTTPAYYSGYGGGTGYGANMYDQYAAEMAQLQGFLSAYTAGTLGQQLGITSGSTSSGSTSSGSTSSGSGGQARTPRTPNIGNIAPVFAGRSPVESPGGRGVIRPGG